MASYFEWNEAIARFFVEGIPSGDALYLSVDEDTLVEIASYAFSEEEPTNPVIDFELAVEEECVSGGRVTLPGTAPQEPSGAPACLAFLSAMVLAAYRMARKPVSLKLITSPGCGKFLACQMEAGDLLECPLQPRKKHSGFR